ncbi:hypothetical protein BGX26_011979 [Mortierella sp. AD094]|nr:hypothetical protein BGX26_011979 [Mortierella sp. AD094]
MKITALVSLSAVILACADALSATNADPKGHAVPLTHNPNHKHNTEAQVAKLSKRYPGANILAVDEDCDCSETCDSANMVCVPGINDYCIIHSGSGGSGSGSGGSGSGSGSSSPSRSMGHKVKPIWFL